MSFVKIIFGLSFGGHPVWGTSNFGDIQLGGHQNWLFNCLRNQDAKPCTKICVFFWKSILNLDVTKIRILFEILQRVEESQRVF